MIPDRWYPILESRRLRTKPVGVERLGERLVLWRDGSGTPQAAPAACPHRGADLAQGRVTDGALVCPWHGFRFAGDGRCTLVPCDGADARIPHALDLAPRRLREAHGLLWLWHGDTRRATEELPFFDEGRGDEGWAEASYLLPYHYSRMVETNLDLHHTPFVHGNLVPAGTRVDDFHASIDGDRIDTRGTLVREDGSRPLPFRASLILPGTVRIALTAKLFILAAATPVDASRSWMWFRYVSHHDVPRPVQRAIAWFMVQSELRVVQRQDWRIFRGMTPGTIDDVPYRFVHADAGIALYRKRRRELLDAASADASPQRATG